MWKLKIWATDFFLYEDSLLKVLASSAAGQPAALKIWSVDQQISRSANQISIGLHVSKSAALQFSRSLTTAIFALLLFFPVRLSCLNYVEWRVEWKVEGYDHGGIKIWSGPGGWIGLRRVAGVQCVQYITSWRRTVRLGSLQCLYERFLIRNLTGIVHLYTGGTVQEWAPPVVLPTCFPPPIIVDIHCIVVLGIQCSHADIIGTRASPRDNWARS